MKNDLVGLWRFIEMLCGNRNFYGLRQNLICTYHLFVKMSLRKSEMSEFVALLVLTYACRWRLLVSTFIIIIILFIICQD